ncbi:MAG: biopolymer transporter ExbD [Parvularculaceae bacterium]
MRKKVRHQEDAADVNVTPLLDIVFIMLIFFIVTATFVYEDGFSPNLPQNSDNEDSIPPPSLLLTVMENGLVRIDDADEVDPRSVKPRAGEFFAANPTGVVIVSAMPNSEAGVAMTVLDEARGADVAKWNQITFTLANR